METVVVRPVRVRQKLLPKLPLRDGNWYGNPPDCVALDPSETSSKGWKRRWTRAELEKAARFRNFL